MVLFQRSSFEHSTHFPDIGDIPKKHHSNDIHAKTPKILQKRKFFGTDSKASNRCCDTRVAKVLGCSKAYVGILRKEIRDLLLKNGVDWAPDSGATTVGEPQ